MCGDRVTYRAAKSSSSGFDMKTKSKIWLGVGAFVVVGTGATSATGVLAAQAAFGLSARPDLPIDAAIASAVRKVVAIQAGTGQDTGGRWEERRISRLTP